MIMKLEMKLELYWHLLTWDQAPGWGKGEKTE